MIHFRKIRWKNLLSTGNTFSEIDLSATRNTLIVGANGSGKSTLMDILAGETNADRGKVVLKRNCKVAYLKQEQYKQ